LQALMTAPDPVAAADTIRQNLVRQQQLHQQAVDAVAAYDRNLGQSATSMPAFASPPSFDPHQPVTGVATPGPSGSDGHGGSVPVHPDGAERQGQAEPPARTRSSSTPTHDHPGSTTPEPPLDEPNGHSGRDVGTRPMGGPPVDGVGPPASRGGTGTGGEPDHGGPSHGGAGHGGPDRSGPDRGGPDRGGPGREPAGAPGGAPGGGRGGAPGREPAGAPGGGRGGVPGREPAGAPGREPGGGRGGAPDGARRPGAGESAGRAGGPGTGTGGAGGIGSGGVGTGSRGAKGPGGLPVPGGPARGHNEDRERPPYLLERDPDELFGTNQPTMPSVIE
jgi:hypothetical protein